MPIEAASGMFRSQDMVKLDFVVPRDVAHDVLYEVGRTGIAQFVDLNKGETAFARAFSSELRRCDDIERRLRFFADQIAQFKLPMDDLTAEPELPSNAIDRIERELDVVESQTTDAIFALDSLRADYSNLREVAEVVSRVGGLSGGSMSDTGSGDNLLQRGAAQSVGLVQLCGVIPTKNDITFHRMVFRITRGNAIVRTQPIPEPFDEVLGSGPSATRTQVNKSVFSVFVSSKRLLDKIKKIAESFNARTLSPEQLTKEPYGVVVARMTQIQDTIDRSLTTLTMQLRQIAVQLPFWRAYATMEKAIHANMNLLRCPHGAATSNATVWIPEQDSHILHSALALGCRRAGTTIVPLVNRSPVQVGHPTFFRTNKITEVFQGLVDSFGTARYKEANPAVLTMVTFPYLFGVMFGDIGHGFMLALFGAFLVLFESKLGGIRNEMFSMVFGGRYLILLMGIFATYIGLLYNDFFGMSLEIFPSGYEWPALPSFGPGAKGNNAPRGIVHPIRPNGLPSVKPANPVVIGIDGAWSETENKLEFYNSVKMKCAVIIGVIQMTAGLFLGLTNHLRSKDWRHIWFGFIPEVLFLTCTFGYMCLLILIKWLTPWPNTNLAPSLLETMTNFFLAPGFVNVELYSGQGAVQAVLLVIAFAQVPLLLLAIPFLEWRDSKRVKPQKEERQALVGSQQLTELKAAPPAAGGQYGSVEQPAAAQAHPAHDSHASEVADTHHGSEHTFDMGEVAIHYVIHTIEFVLGCVSNTASYLRLWALSLAHAQLADVFLNFTLVKSIDMDGGYGVAVFIGIAVWLGATIGILLCMESLSAFLHALRLHWVEFQNKFFAADGIQFIPFDLLRDVRVERS